MDTFDPRTPLTRGMMVTLLYNHAGRPDVSEFRNWLRDVPEGKYYTDAVKWARERYVVGGRGGRLLLPFSYLGYSGRSAIIYSVSKNRFVSHFVLYLISVI